MCYTYCNRTINRICTEMHGSGDANKMADENNKLR